MTSISYQIIIAKANVNLIQKTATPYRPTRFGVGIAYARCRGQMLPCRCEVASPMARFLLCFQPFLMKPDNTGQPPPLICCLLHKGSWTYSRLSFLFQALLRGPAQITLYAAHAYLFKSTVSGIQSIPVLNVSPAMSDWILLRSVLLQIASASPTPV